MWLLKAHPPSTLPTPVGFHVWKSLWQCHRFLCPFSHGLWVANKLLVASALMCRWNPKKSEHLLTAVKDAASQPHGKETTRWETISYAESPPLLQSSCLWLGRVIGMISLPPQCNPNQCIPAAQLSTRALFHSLTHHHKLLQSSSSSNGKETSAFGSIHSPSASDKDRNWTKSSASILTQLDFWLWDVFGSSERLQWQNHKVFPTLPLSYPEAFRFCRSFPYLFLMLFYWPAPLAHHCKGPAARNKQLRKSQWLISSHVDLCSTQTAFLHANAMERERLGRRDEDPVTLTPGTSHRAQVAQV